MSCLTIPEVPLFAALETALRVLRADAAQPDNTPDTLLEKLLGPLRLGQTPLLAEARTMLRTQPTQPNNYLQLGLGYDENRKGLPAIHLLVPSEMPGGMDGLGSGYGVDEDGNDVFVTSYTGSYTALITGASATQSLLIYHLIRSQLVQQLPALEEAGIRLGKMGGNELSLFEQPGPLPLHSRMLTFTFTYQTRTPLDPLPDLTGLEFDPEIRA
jgi:hypothetical protein